jgi:hypothetical protein
MSMQLLRQEDLEQWTGYQRRADIERFLRKTGISFTYGKNNKICTTQHAVDSALNPKDDNGQEVSF